MTLATVTRESRHVCWVVDGTTDYVGEARELLAGAAASRRKPVAFGPRGGAVLSALVPSVAHAGDPASDVLHGGPLVPEEMFAMFRAQTARAREEGCTGLCLVADMDWLLPVGPSPADVVAFELLLDRVVRELDAVVVCAYRRATFDAATVEGTLCVHPAAHGATEPPFVLVAGDEGTWRLAGEVDFSAAPAFAAAVGAAVREQPCVIDARGLTFVDVAGLRELARAATGRPVELRGVPEPIRRWWTVGRFGDLAPEVRLAG